MVHSHMSRPKKRTMTDINSKTAKQQTHIPEETKVGEAAVKPLRMLLQLFALLLF